MFRPRAGFVRRAAPRLDRHRAMQLTKKFVKAKNPCAGGYKWFLRDHNGQGDYQAVLDALVADGRVLLAQVMYQANAFAKDMVAA